MSLSKRPLRSLLIGDCDHYFSPYIFGVSQGMTRLGHWHSQVNLRQSLEAIERRVMEVDPDILWTHMYCWPPAGSPSVDALIELAERAARRGVKVILHDGDPGRANRFPHDLSSWCTLALCNHTFDRSEWRVPTLRWPYFAFAQDAIATPSAAWSCRLFFAGTVQHDDTYSPRTRLLNRIEALGVSLRTPAETEGNTLFRTPEIAAPANAILGFGRPESTGWIDTRVFQYPGAGGILLHDDAEMLSPWEHYVPYESGSAESVVDSLTRLERMTAHERQALRERAFAFVQENHSSIARVRTVIERLFA